jgi:endonuclease YncB( thermonuclease family)
MGCRYRRRHVRAILVVLSLSLLVFEAQQHNWLNAGQLFTADQPGLYAVNHFMDGDTIVVNINGAVESVRLIGVNTPVQCYGPQAAAFTQRTIGHNRVRLVSDSLSTNRDRYNRLLRYVYLPDGRNLDEVLIQNG